MANLCKYYKQVRQVSYDSGATWINVGEVQKGDLYEYNSPSCGGVKEYRWVDVTGAYTCVGTTKYQKTKKQESTDGGSTWQDVSPAEYGTGVVIEYASTDCGYDPSYVNQYLTFIPRSNGQFKFNSYIGSTVINAVSYSLDGGSTWTRLLNDTYTPTVQAGQKIMWKGNFTSSFNPGTGVGYSNTFTSNVNYDIEGNIMSLAYGDNFQGKTNLSGTYGIFKNLFNSNFGKSPVNAENLVLPATTLGEECYNLMFWGCSGLTTTPQLPATTLAPSCYEGMFDSCSSLTAVPSLPATTLATRCYAVMFRGCSSLTTVPSDLLPATTAADHCYYQMFSECTNLKSVPDLPATTLAPSCYSMMFYDCGKLEQAQSILPATTLATMCYAHMFANCDILYAAPTLPAPTLVDRCYVGMFENTWLLDYIICLATDISASNCTYDWFASNGAVRGDFYKAPGMNNWTRGSSGIPSSWTVHDYNS